MTCNLPNRSRALAAGTLLLLFVCAGCQSDRSSSSGWLGKNQAATARERNKIDSTRIKTRDDIVQIVQFWNQPYWLQDSRRVSGFKVTVYFVSGESEKGAFVPGNIFVWVYELVPTAPGQYEKKIAHVWEFDEKEAMATRVNKRAVGGYFYGFPLKWPASVSLEGKQIEIQIGYERIGNKQVVLSSPRRFHVPVPIEFASPDKQAGY